MRTTETLSINELDRAAAILRDGGLVAFPTETVFGLGADATNESAIQSLFQAKGRPSDNPLIVHLAHRDQLREVCTSIPRAAELLLHRFTPGPLTLVLPKSDSIASSVTAGLKTVAVRIPSHAIAQLLLGKVMLPIAAPSANISGRPSGTRWRSVLEDLDGRIDAILCEDGCSIGIESTVVDVTCSPPRLLRQGAITWEQLIEVLPDVLNYQSSEGSRANPDSILSSLSPANSPGLRHRHYQPNASVEIIETPAHIPEPSGKGAYIGFMVCKHGGPQIEQWIVESNEQYAAMLYEFFRHADRQGAPRIWCQSVAEIGLGGALMDRLRRAASKEAIDPQSAQ